MPQYDLENLEQRIDRDRRQEEDELFLLLLLLMRTARNRADSAIALGVDPFAAVRDVLTGNTALGIAPAAPRVARRLASADRAGFRRTVRVLGGEAEAYAPAQDYNRQAAQAVARMLGTLQSRIATALREAAGKGQQAARKALRQAFVGGGYVESATSKAWLLESTATTLVGFAYNGGWFNGLMTSGPGAGLKGFRYSATLDSRTTNICRAYHGVKLPFDHPWWQTHWPLCHFNCRSVVLPIFTAFEPTEPVWQPWPMPGFGHAPAISAGIRYVRDVRVPAA